MPIRILFMLKIISALSIFICVLNPLKAQQKFLPLHNESNRIIEADMIQKEQILHSSVKPFLESELDTLISPDSLHKAWYSDKKQEGRSILSRKLFNEHLLQYSGKSVSLSADLLFDFSLGREQGRGTVFNNTRGLQMQGNLGTKFSFYTSFYENLSRLPSYINAYSAERGVVPGEGKARISGKNVDYAIPYGYVSYTPNTYFNFQFGQGKNFFGDGYRSLILSDYAYNYPFLKISTRFWKIKYVNLWTQYQDISNGFKGPTYPKKYASYQYLSFAANPKLNISLFQSLIWAPDTAGKGGIQLEYLNPLIFMNSLNFNIGSPANSMMGLNLRYNLFKRYSAYGQFILDDFNLSALKTAPGFFQQKYGFQLGLKAFDLFGIKNLYLQTELNRVRPYVYGHRTLKINNSHFNEPLAHPLGANFTESILQSAYKYKRIALDLKLLYARYGADSNGSHYGKNIFLSDYDAPNGQNSYGNFTGQGVKTDLYYANPNLSYLLNPSSNLKLEAGMTYRKERSALASKQSNMVYVGIKTALTNKYSDF